MDDDKKILYILIGSGKKPLAGYGAYKGDFIKICENQLAKCKANQSACINSGDFKMFYQNENNITYLLMTMPIYPLPTAVSCIESLKKELSSELSGRNFANVQDYGLNNEFQEKLKMKFEYFNENTEVVSEKIQGLKSLMMQYKEDVFKAADALNERGELLEQMQNKAKDLENDSYSFKKGAIKVRRTECKRKVIYILVILGLLAVIGLIIGLSV